MLGVMSGDGVEESPGTDCPGCGGLDVMRIQYGLPTDPRGPRVVHGGYVVAGGTPTWLCAQCRPQWGGVHWEQSRELDPIEDTASSPRRDPR